MFVCVCVCVCVWGGGGYFLTLHLSACHGNPWGTADNVEFCQDAARLYHLSHTDLLPPLNLHLRAFVCFLHLLKYHGSVLK